MATNQYDDSNRSSDEENDSDEQFDNDDDSSASSADSDDDSPSFVDSDDDSPSPITAQNITLLMEKCRVIISTVRKCYNLLEFVQAIAEDHSIKSGLIIDMKIRWNSSYKMLTRLALYQHVLEKLYDQIDHIPGITNQQRKKLIDSKLDGNDWHLIHVLRRVLERFEEATKILSGQSYPTLSLCYAIVTSLSYYLKNRSDDTIENDIKNLLIIYFDKHMVRTGKQFDFIRVSALFDPLVHDLLTDEDKRAAEMFIIKEVNNKYFH